MRLRFHSLTLCIAALTVATLALAIPIFSDPPKLLGGENVATVLTADQIRDLMDKIGSDIQVFLENGDTERARINFLIALQVSEISGIELPDYYRRIALQLDTYIRFMVYNIPSGIPTDPIRFRQT